MIDDFGAGRRRPVTTDGFHRRTTTYNPHAHPDARAKPAAGHTSLPSPVINSSNKPSQRARNRQHQTEADEPAADRSDKSEDSTDIRKRLQSSSLSNALAATRLKTNKLAGDTADDVTDSSSEPSAETIDEIDTIIAQLDAGQPPQRQGWFGRLRGKLTRTQWLVIAGVFLFVVGSGTVAYALLRPEKTPPATAATTPKKKAPAPVPPPPPTSPLTGLEVSAEDAKRVVTGVMIENSTFARPQSSLQQAGVVYEAIAEYGITRFLALFQEAKPGNIGPVRSVRPYYVDWAKIYDAPIAHVGGSPDALAKIKAEGVKDLDQFFNSAYYHRIGSREAPHNMYTSMDQLNKAAAAKGWTASTFTPWQRKKEAGTKDTGKAPAAGKINIAISGPTYNVHYDYDVSNNRYLRVMAGAPHNDAENGQITPKVVIAIATSYGLEPDGYHSRYATTGSGKAFIFQDGGVTPATWNRQGNEQYSFTADDGKPVKLNAGQTWLTFVGDPTAVTYTP